MAYLSDPSRLRDSGAGGDEMIDTLTELYAQTNQLRTSFIAAGIGTLHLDHALFQLEREMEETRRGDAVGKISTTGDTVEVRALCDIP